MSMYKAISVMNSTHFAMLNMMVKCVALEVAAFGIRVNAVAPGIVYNPSDKARFKNLVMLDPYNKKHLEYRVDPGEVAKTMLFLASKESSHTTGEILEMDDGLKFDVQVYDKSYYDRKDRKY